jgi:hypothetical protein
VVIAMCPSTEQGQPRPPVPPAIPGQVQVFADLANPCATR